MGHLGRYYPSTSEDTASPFRPFKFFPFKGWAYMAWTDSIPGVVKSNVGSDINIKARHLITNYVVLKWINSVTHLYRLYWK